MFLQVYLQSLKKGQSFIFHTFPVHLPVIKMIFTLTGHSIQCFLQVENLLAVVVVGAACDGAGSVIK